MLLFLREVSFYEIQAFVLARPLAGTDFESFLCIEEASESPQPSRPCGKLSEVPRLPSNWHSHELGAPTEYCVVRAPRPKHLHLMCNFTYRLYRDPTFEREWHAKRSF